MTNSDIFYFFKCGLGLGVYSVAKVLAQNGQSPPFDLQEHIKSGVVVYTCDPRTEEVDTGASRSSLALQRV